MNHPPTGPASCARCRAPLTGDDEAVEVDGHHRHRFTNSAGLHFVVACYAHAPGTAAGGPATDEDSWFAGHTWQRVFCRQCGAHAGWLFRSKTRVFFCLQQTATPTT